MAGYIGSKASVVSSGAERKKVFDITGTTTSLTGCSYTPNQVHVFHNGVRLVDGTDYTATDGSTVTLTTAAQSGDEVVVISYATFQTSDTVSASAGGTFTGDVTFGGAFTSRGIDDNATSTAMTLDTSGNLLVGKTSNSFGTAGVALNPSGSNNMTRAGDPPLALNRLTSDGGILGFYKDGSTVGSIGAVSSKLTVGTGIGALQFDGPNQVIRPFRVDTNVTTDAVLQLGSSTNRFTNLYLSGGVYLGGTGAANYLDDYEEGTFTPILAATITDPTVTYNAQAGRYTKIGNTVNIRIFINITAISGGSGNVQIAQLPFTIANTGIYSGFSIGNMRNIDIPTNVVQVNVNGGGGDTSVTLRTLFDNADWGTIPIGNVGSTFGLYLSGTYEAG